MSPSPLKMDNLDDSNHDKANSKDEALRIKKMTQRAPFIILLIIALAAAGVAYYYYRQSVALKTNPQKIAQEEVEQLTEVVGKLIVLPEGEQPTVATVVDPERLKDQPFFARAKVGDKVLIYTNAKKVILYDPAQNIILETASLTIGNP